MRLRALARRLPFTKELRNACELAAHTAGIALRLRDPLVPPKWLFRDPDRVDGSHSPEEFLDIGRGTVQWMIDYKGLLQPTHRVLDVGCGIGRMAIHFAEYLQKGKYHGFDIAKWKVGYCRRTVGRKRPDFGFHHADVFNKYYNPQGRMRACEYRFPFEDESFEFVFLISVFTHMLTNDMEHYLSEVARVLSPGGKCYISYKLTDSKRGPPWHSVSDVCEIANPNEPEHGVAYLEQFVRDLYPKYGLRIESLSPSADRGKPDSDHGTHQDNVIAVKPGR